MSVDVFAAVSRALAAANSRRTALGVLLASLTAAFPAESDARLRPGKSKNTNWRKEKKKDKNKRNRHKNKNDKGGGSTSGDCTVRHSEQEILGFISKAAKEYGQSENVMVRVARCESTLNPCALNPDGPYYGLFQYLKSTWRTTPFGDRDIYDPEAQALATGWMWKEGRKNEWACQ
jgi:hypothetical protein